MESFSDFELQACFVALNRAAKDYEISEKVGGATDDRQKQLLSGAFAAEAVRIAGKLDRHKSLAAMAPDELNVMMAALRYIVRKRWEFSETPDLSDHEKKKARNVALAFDAIATKIETLRKNLTN